MNQQQLRELADLAELEPAFTRVSMDNLSNEGLIRTQLQVELGKHFRAKESSSRLVERIQKVMGENLSRAQTIAQTEKTRALNGQRIGDAIREYTEAHDKAVRGHRKRPELPEGQWINPRTAKEPRAEHVAISGDVRPVGEEFLPGLRYPGDPSGPPHQTINCHCIWRRVNRG